MPAMSTASTGDGVQATTESSEPRERFAFRMTDSFDAGDCFAFLFEDEHPPNGLGDVIFGEVLKAYRNGRYLVKAYCSCEAKSAVTVYSPCCMNVKLTREQFDRSAAAGWPREVAWLRQLLAS